MKLGEALKKSPMVRRMSWLPEDETINVHNIPNGIVLLTEDLLAKDWEPVIEKKKVKKKFYLGHNGIRHLEDYITCSNLHPDTELLKKAQWDNILEIEIEVDEE